MSTESEVPHPGNEMGEPWLIYEALMQFLNTEQASTTDTSKQ